MEENRRSSDGFSPPPKDNPRKNSGGFDASGEDRFSPASRRPLRDLFGPRDVPYLALFLAAFLILFKGFFFQGGVFFERDGAVLEIPTRQLTVQLLREGNFALWTDAHGNGQPFLANPKNAVCYPTTWLYLVLPFFTAFRFHYLLHAILGWLGFYGLLKFFRMSRPAAFLGASLFSFSGPYLSNFEFYNHVAAFAWTPWILLLAFSDSLRGQAEVSPVLREESMSTGQAASPRRGESSIHPQTNILGFPRWGFKRTAALALLWALQLLAGTPEAVVITLLFALGESFFLSGKILKRSGVILASLAIGTLIAAVQYVPAFETLGRTERVTVEMSAWPLELIQLANIPFPDVLGSDRGPGRGDFWAGHLFDKGAPLYYSFYLGAAGLLLFFLGLFKPMEKDRRGFRVALALFFLMANGRYFPLNEILVRVPILSSIRYPVKYMMGVLLAFALIAAAFYDDYFIKKRIGFPRIRRGLITFLGIGTAVFLLVPWLGRLLAGLFVIRDAEALASVRNSLYAGLAVLAAAGLILGLSGLRKIRAWIPAFLFALLALADPLFHNARVNPTVPESFFNTPEILRSLRTPATIYRQEIIPDDLRIRLGDGRKAQNFLRQSLFPFSGINDGLRYVFNRDFFALYPSDQREIRRASSGWTEAQLLKYLRSLGCEYLLGPNPLKSVPRETRLFEGFPLSLQDIGTGRTFPYLVQAAVVGVGETEKWKLFAADDFDPFATAIVENAIPGVADSTIRGTGEVAIIRETQGRAAYRTRTAAPAILVFRGNWAPGWKARIDGKNAPVLKVNLGLKGVRIPEGSHSVEIRYLPAGFIVGAVLSGLTLLVLLASGGVIVLRSKRRGRFRLTSFPRPIE
jgi:hypothetical protein